MVSAEIVQALMNEGVNLFVTLPCEKARPLSNLVYVNFRHIALTREEEGVGISAGAYMAGAKPAMLVQSSGIGNMVNALCSLTKAYKLPLPIFVSWRGVYREEIPTQVPLGKRLTQMFAALNIDYNIIESPEDASVVSEAVVKVYAKNTIHAILLNPKIWAREEAVESKSSETEAERRSVHYTSRVSKPSMTRFEILKILALYLEGKIVVCNLGIPCKELYQVKHQKSNFYMLGSMGLASSIGLGIATFTRKDVVVIDGDGSLLMNLGTLSTIAVAKPRNLTILAIDNGVHGSTGNQPTATSHGVDLELIARGSGLNETYKVASRDEITSTLNDLGKGPNFVHVLAKSGNAKVPNVSLTPVQIKQNVMEAIRE